MKYIHARTTARRRLASRLLHGTAVAGLAAMSATAAAAQTSASDQAVETVTVTGTSIPGAAAVGANIITVDRPEIEASGATSIQQLLANVPSITGFGNPGQGPLWQRRPVRHGRAHHSQPGRQRLQFHPDPGRRSSPAFVGPLPHPGRSQHHSHHRAATGRSAAGRCLVDLWFGCGCRRAQFHHPQGLPGAPKPICNMAMAWITTASISARSWARAGTRARWMAAYNYTSLSQLAGSARNFVNDNQTFRGLSNFGNFTCGPATASPTGGAARD